MSSSESLSGLARLTDWGFERARGTSSSESEDSSFLTGFFLTTGDVFFFTCGDGFAGFDFVARGMSSSESDVGFLTFGFFAGAGFGFVRFWPRGISSSSELGGVFRLAWPYPLVSSTLHRITFDPFATGRFI
jgi:hypothetical protein